MLAITTSNKVLVDLAFILPVTGKEKIIFSRSGKTSLWFDFKKIFWGKRMEEEAAKRIKDLITKNSDIDSTFKTKVQNISSKNGIDESLVIEAYTDIARKKRLELTNQDLPAALNGAKTIINGINLKENSFFLKKYIFSVPVTLPFLLISTKALWESAFMMRSYSKL